MICAPLAYLRGSIDLLSDDQACHLMCEGHLAQADELVLSCPRFRLECRWQPVRSADDEGSAAASSLKGLEENSSKGIRIAKLSCKVKHADSPDRKSQAVYVEQQGGGGMGGSECSAILIDFLRRVLCHALLFAHSE